MDEKQPIRQSSKRQNFRTNLETFSNIVKFFDRVKLEKSFQPRLHKQETCILQYFSAPQPVTLKYLDDALAKIGSIPGFTAKAKNLISLRTNEGFPEFHSVLIELWFAAQFVCNNSSVMCEPETTEGHRAEFKVTVNGEDVYFEVRNLEPSEWVRVGVSASKSQPRSKILKLQDIIRQAFYQLPYPYHVKLRPENLEGDENSFVADIHLAIEELRILLRDIHQAKETLPIHFLKLPRNRLPRLTVLEIDKTPGLQYAWLGWVESFSDRLQKLANSAQDKIRAKGPQLTPNTANVLVVGLPFWAQSLSFAHELVGPLTETNGGTQASSAAVNNLGSEVGKRTSAFVFFQPADRIDLYPGWIDLVLNPIGNYPLPKSVQVILTKLSTNLD
jgi:hypothetical protein